MNKANIEASVERLMAQVDYYLHCELDEEYDHARPDSARRQLEAALRQELLFACAGESGSMAVAASVQFQPDGDGETDVEQRNAPA